MNASSTPPTGPTSTTGTGSGAQIVGQSQNFGGGPGPHVMAADTLQGDKVVNMSGEDLGKIEDIMLDVPSGRIAYAVLSFGGIMGMGDKLFAIPWSALTMDTDRECFVLDIDKDRLKNAPGFDKDHWPSMADPTWASNVYNYYHMRPYWE
ncbi:MAG TPA: PRC-barrel domain-containing protein [Burkholderiaceae bacterium]|nr:PRC-barrel domain-containing protein [Burkholderiaceae bacterium]